MGKARKTIALFGIGWLPLGLCGCGGKDSNAAILHDQLSGQLSFSINMADLLFTGTPQWCTSGVTAWGAYYGEGSFQSDNQLLSPSGGFPLSEEDRGSTLSYLAFTVLKARYVRTTAGLNQRCYVFDPAAVASAHAVFRNGASSTNHTQLGVPGQPRDPNWDVLIPIGAISVDSVSFVNEYKVNLGIEYTCRSYQVAATYHGVVNTIDGRQFHAETSFCLDPQDNRWHQQQFKWI